MEVRDEVCGMAFPAEHAAVRLEFEGKIYFFCAERCRALFRKNPHWYVPVHQGHEHAV